MCCVLASTEGGVGGNWVKSGVSEAENLKLEDVVLTCDPPSVLEKQSCGLSFTQTLQYDTRGVGFSTHQAILPHQLGTLRSNVRSQRLRAQSTLLRLLPCRCRPQGCRLFF